MLARITANPTLIDTLSAIIELLAYILMKIIPNRRITHGTFKAYRYILEALEKGQVERAKELNRVHIRGVSNRLIRKYAKGRNVSKSALQATFSIKGKVVRADNKASKEERSGGRSQRIHKQS